MAYKAIKGHEKSMSVTKCRKINGVPQRECWYIDQLKATIAAQAKEIERLKKLKEYMVNTFRQHKENKWNWSDEDVLHILRATLMPDEEFEALKGE